MTPFRTPCFVSIPNLCPFSICTSKRIHYNHIQSNYLAIPYLRYVSRACIPSPSHHQQTPIHLPNVQHFYPITQKFHSHAENANFESDYSSTPPSQPPSGTGSGSGDKADHESDSNDESNIQTLLHRFGYSEQTLPTDLASLSKTQLASFLNASKLPLARFLARIWPAWRRRVIADVSFAFKVTMELTVGVALSSSGMIAARGDRILQELDFAICDIAVGATLNFILVFLLAPVAATRPGMFSALPSNCFSTGMYSISQRIASLLYKGILFSVCGFMGSVVGSSLSQTLLQLRSAIAKKNGKEVEPKKLPNILVNSAAWAGFMFFSSNPRYQSVAGVERLLFSFTPDAIAKIASACLRTGNNVLGGATWVWWARAIGLQKIQQN